MNPMDAIIDKSDEQKLMHAAKLRAGLREVLRQSVPTDDAPKYWELGWVYIMPDFDTLNHSIVEWVSDKMPVYPPRSDQQTTENVNDRAGTQRTA